MSLKGDRAACRSQTIGLGPSQENVPIRIFAKPHDPCIMGKNRSQRMHGKKIIFALGIIFLFCVPGAFKADEIPYETAHWDAQSLGNHRVVIRVSQFADAILAHIPWRRRDFHPERKNLIVVDAHTGMRIKNVFRGKINRESGDIIFQPDTIPGDYYVYYLPYIMKGRSNYPTVIYPEPENTADPVWLAKNELKYSASQYNTLPRASIMKMEAIDAFNSFFPMEVIATAQETQDLITSHPDVDYLLFPEDREHSIRMTTDLPFRWIQKGPQLDFTGKADRGEFYAFQIGVFAARKDIDDMNVSFSSLVNRDAGAIIPAYAFQSINTEGINWDGLPFNKVCPVKKGTVQPLWCGIKIPKRVPPGHYEASLTVSPKSCPSTQIALHLNVTEKVLSDSGDSRPQLQSRLRWLNSRIAVDDTVVSPFIPLSVTGHMISCLGRRLVIGEDGLPQNIESFFTPEVTRIGKTARNILAAPFKLIVDNGPKILTWKDKGMEFTKQKGGVVVWHAEKTAGPLTAKIKGYMECDGYVNYSIKLRSSEFMDVRDIRLEIPYKKDSAKYILGLGQKGGFRPTRIDWKWDKTKNQDAVWMGDVSAGLYASFRAENYSRPLNTNFYQLKPLNMPPSWENGGRGGCRIRESDARTVTLTMFSGPRTLQPGHELFYNFILLITPFKPINTHRHWKTRFYHAFKPIDEIAATGANTINNHHANDVNPYINYPFIHTKQMKAYVEEAHAKGLKVKIYYTIRELSNHAYELFALRSLGHEIFTSGKGGGYSWLQEHLGSDYIAAWFVPKLKDAAIINSGMSRWHNYYLEGLNWLAQNIGIDGLYIDDVAYNRTTMKRVRKILDRSRKGALIDLHSANQFNPRDGFINSALLYMEHFPYINRLWFGEYFDYDSKPDFWLTEVSGLPFGLMGEMLQGGGNPWRGMVYGMTSRLPWAGNPTHIWKVWDDFSIQDSEMFGYWSNRCPVKTNNPVILATAYVRKKKILISIASWADAKTDITLKINWKALGLDPANAILAAPEVPEFQKAAKFRPSDKIPVEPGKGWLLVLKPINE